MRLQNKTKCVDASMQHWQCKRFVIPCAWASGRGKGALVQSRTWKTVWRKNNALVKNFHKWTEVYNNVFFFLVTRRSPLGRCRVKGPYDVLSRINNPVGSQHVKTWERCGNYQNGNTNMNNENSDDQCVMGNEGGSPYPKGRGLNACSRMFFE